MVKCKGGDEMEKDFSELECVLNELKNMYIIIGAFCKNEEELKKMFFK